MVTTNPAANTNASTRQSRRGAGVATGRAVRGAWMGAAHLVSSTARRVGPRPRDLDPALRRDGLGFTLIGLCRGGGGDQWWGLAGAFGQAEHAVIGQHHRSAGVHDLALRWSWSVSVSDCSGTPKRPRPDSRIGIGLAALTVAATGLVHLSQHLPTPAEGSARMRDAGGIIGVPRLQRPLRGRRHGYGAIALLLRWWAASA